ncbi:hypothetical protein POM88_037245 [Heracleum sosnowskyi]|uniref:Xylanase inhibitor N-terminal domain-containing protein n=1 Tax=Heracleum sosnowskyi TaxID=360622 RepID=A0AAD8HQQ9_9APIA|nr:hypothetical protein POM88_037245 [Heracleum sosnowskyi]
MFCSLSVHTIYNICSCGYDQEQVVLNGVHPPYTDGVLDLGTRNTTILAQLRKVGMMQNIFSHCFSAQEGGYLFMGDDILPSSGIVLAPMLNDISSDFYNLGPAAFRFDGQATGVEYLLVFFDSGSTYTYFGYPAYQALLDMLQLSPEAYLIISDLGNVCLGILNAAVLGMISMDSIGEISMQDQIVIYDLEKYQIGWPLQIAVNFLSSPESYSCFSFTLWTVGGIVTANCS